MKTHTGPPILIDASASPLPADPVLIAEHYVLGQILGDPDRFDEVVGQLEAADFYGQDYSAIYTAMCATRDDGFEVVTPSVAQRVESVNREHILDVLVECEFDLRGFPKRATDSFGKSMFESCVEIVATNAVRRRVSQKAGTVPGELEKPGAIAPGEVQRIAQEVVDVAQERSAKVVSGPEDALDDIRAALDPSERMSGISTGFRELDELEVRLSPGSLTVIAARPSVGKSAFASSMVGHLGIGNGIRTLLVSLEVDRRDVIRGIIHAHAVAPHSNPSENEEHRLHDTAAAYSKSPIFINDATGLTVSNLMSMIRRAVIARGVQVVVIDYLQLLKREDKASREREVAEQSLLMKTVARECGIAVVLLCQLNREAEGRVSGRGNNQTKRGVPRLSDLRESGSIEQDADCVMLLYREALYADHPEDPRSRQDALVIVAKNRNGPTGSVTLDFIPACTAFRSSMSLPPIVDRSRPAPIL